MPRSRRREPAYQHNEIMKELDNQRNIALPAMGVPGGNPNRSTSELPTATRITRRRFLERTALCATAAGLGVPALEAQDWAQQAVDKSPRKHETVKVTYNDRSVDTFIAYPQSQGKSPAVILIHDVIAFAPWVENVADKFAEAGYLALAPDLLSGRTPEERQPLQSPTGTIGPARRLPLPQVAADMNALADYAKKLPACNGKVCVVGFSWGGDQAFRFATTRKDLSAAFVFYGICPEPENIPNIVAPVYGFYAGTDTRVGATIAATKDQMKAAGKFYEPVTYEGAGHGFMQAGAKPDATGPDKKAWDESWVKLKALRSKFD
jgi:carboxymethylenebutenolidase